jgi:arylsulfatase A-like enzyme
MDSRTKKKLNILTILTDQQRFDTLSCMGNSVVHTPNLDRLAFQGVLFTQAVCAYPLCGPSRASLLTGMYSHGHHYRGNAEMDESGLPETVITVDEILSNHGYHTEYHGKWHVGKGHMGCYTGGIRYGHHTEEYKAFLDRKYPRGQLEAGYKVDRYTGREYKAVPLDDMMEKALKDGYHMPHHNEAGELKVAAEDTLTAWTASQFIRFLQSKPEEPFAATCSILHPHAPLVAAKPYFDMYDPASMPMPDNITDDCRVKKPKCVPDAVPLTPEGMGTYIALYYGLVKEVDDWVGRILDELERSGLRDNTLVIFTSDHGEMAGSHGTLSKMELFEEAIRVPLMMSLPGVIPENRRLDDSVTGADLLPTILDFAGIEIPGNVHGRSVKPLVTGESRDIRQFAYCEFRDQRALRSTEWKLILNPSLDSNLDERCLLYHLSEDQGEQRNLLSDVNRSAGYLSIAEKLKQEMVSVMKDIRVPQEEVDRYANFEF